LAVPASSPYVKRAAALLVAVTSAADAQAAQAEAAQAAPGEHTRDAAAADAKLNAKLDALFTEGFAVADSEVQDMYML